MIALTNNDSTLTQSLVITLGGSATTTYPTVSVDSYIVPNILKNDYSEYPSAAEVKLLTTASETTIAAAPQRGQNKVIHSISVYNADTVSTTVTIARDDNGTNRNIVKWTLLTGETMHYQGQYGGRGWYSTDANGNVKEAIGPINSSSVLGTTTNDNAAAGRIGEITESTVLAGSAISLTSTVSADITSISLTAGDWNVWGNVATLPAAGTTTSSVRGWVNDAAATFPTSPGAGAVALCQAAIPADGLTILPVGMRRYSLASTTTVYLGIRAGFAVSTMQAFGYIGARRVR